VAPAVMASRDAGDDAYAELRTKYAATTRLLALQCDTIEKLHATQQWSQGKENYDNSGSSEPSSCDAGAGAGPAGFEPRYRRAKRLIKMQASVLATAFLFASPSPIPPVSIRPLTRPLKPCRIVVVASLPPIPPVRARALSPLMSSNT
jgi:hypothetical protein